MNTKPPKHKSTRGRNSLAGVDPVERPILSETGGTSARLGLAGPDLRRAAFGAMAYAQLRIEIPDLAEFARDMQRESCNLYCVLYRSDFCLESAVRTLCAARNHILYIILSTDDARRGTVQPW